MYLLVFIGSSIEGGRGGQNEVGMAASCCCCCSPSCCLIGWLLDSKEMFILRKVSSLPGFLLEPHVLHGLSMVGGLVVPGLLPVGAVPLAAGAPPRF